MEHEEFVHLHNHSEFSLLDGLSRVNELVDRAVELNQPAIALTDHGVMYGTMPFYRAAKKAGIKPIIGIETYLSMRGMEDKEGQKDKNRYHMLLLAQNQTGYLNLLKIASAAQLKGYYYKPRIDRAYMANHSDGIIGTTGCMAGEIPQAINNGNMKLAHELMAEYLDIFGKERFFIELQEHHIPELTEINKKLIEMAPRYGLEGNFIATNDVHYTRAEDADPHQTLLCIQTGSTLQNPKMTFSDKEYYLKSHGEMAKLFGDIPSALSNTLLIAEMCDVNLDSTEYHLPEFDVPEGFTPETYLLALCEKGLIWRYGENRAATDDVLRQRLEYELGIIKRMGFDTYFLIVWDLCEWAARTDDWWAQFQDPFPYTTYNEWKKNDIWWNVRGSGAGSVVAYTLGITSIDPLLNNLIFERFLNPGRVSMPDIDLDYPDDTRHWMVAYTKRRYGAEKVAQIITFGTMGARGAIRDVGRAMDMPLDQVDVIARMIPAVPGKPIKIKNVLTDGHEFYSAELTQRYRKEEGVKSLLDTAQNLEGISRHASSHAAGVIVSDRPLVEYVPLNRPTGGDEGLGGVDRVTQWPMEIVESIGLLKVDFLGLSTLTIMRRAARLIEDRYGTIYTMDNIPYDIGHIGPDPDKDPEAAFAMLERGDVAGIFQVEGAGMKRLMMDMKPRRFDHIIAAVALYRPGPMDNIPEYIRRMHADIFEGRDIVEYHTPALEPILSDTYGICVSGDSIVVDAKTGRRLRLDEVGAEDQFTIQGVDENWQSATGAVTHWIDSGHKEVHRVTLRSGSEVKITADHRLLTEKGWLPLKELQAGDYIATPMTLIGGETAVSPIDRRKLRVLAYLIGDGSLASMSAVDFVSKEDALLEEYRRSLEAFDDIKPSYTQQVRGVTRIGAAKANVNGDAHYHTPNALLAWMRELDMKYAPGNRPGGVRSHEKFVPPFVFELGTEDISFFLASLWDCDGHVSNKICHYKTVSPTLADDVRTLLLRLGIHSTTYRNKYEIASGEREAFQVTVYNTAVLMEWLRPFMASSKREISCAGRERLTIERRPFIAEVDQATDLSRRALMAEYGIDRQHFMAGAVQKRPRITTSVVASLADALELPQTSKNLHINWQEIIAIEPAGVEHVYDLTVEKLHNFVANNIIVHNCVYQEQIIRIATDLAGYEPGEADMIRKAVAKKKKKLMDEHRIKFTDGAMANGFTREVCDLIWGDIEFFARYGFNKAHAADYAKVTCQTAFLKAHYPVEYLTAMLSVERDNTDKVRRFFGEAKNLGIDIAPPDINRSRLEFTIEDEGERPLIRFGLGAIKNAGANSLNLIIDEREESGVYTGTQDLCDRVNLQQVGKRPLEFMIKARVFDLWGTPAQFMDALDRIVSYSSNTHKAAAAGQMTLFGGTATVAPMNVDLLHPVEKVAEIEHKELLEFEKEALGVHVSEHPLERPLASLHRITKGFTISSIDANYNGRSVRIGGMISHVRQLTTKKGDPMAFATLEDLDSKIDLVLFPKTWKRVREQVTVDQVMLVVGKVQIQDDRTSLLVDKVQTNIRNDAPADEPRVASGKLQVTSDKRRPPIAEKVVPPKPVVQPAPSFMNGAPPPPPNFDDDFGGEVVPRGGDSVGEKTAVYNSTPSPSASHLEGGAHLVTATRHLIIEIKPVGNWRDACRRSLEKTADYKGDDSITFHFADTRLHIDFPQRRTRTCADLLQNLRLIPGVARVYEEES